jgi:hypothetical protein
VGFSSLVGEPTALSSILDSSVSGHRSVTSQLGVRVEILWSSIPQITGADGIDGHWEHMTDRFEGQQDSSALKMLQFIKMYSSTLIISTEDP